MMLKDQKEKFLRSFFLKSLEEFDIRERALET